MSDAKEAKVQQPAAAAGKKSKRKGKGKKNGKGPANVAAIVAAAVTAAMAAPRGAAKAQTPKKKKKVLPRRGVLSPFMEADKRAVICWSGNCACVRGFTLLQNRVLKDEKKQEERKARLAAEAKSAAQVIAEGGEIVPIKFFLPAGLVGYDALITAIARAGTVLMKGNGPVRTLVILRAKMEAKDVAAKILADAKVPEEDKKTKEAVLDQWNYHVGNWKWARLNGMQEKTLDLSKAAPAKAKAAPSDRDTSSSSSSASSGAAPATRSNMQRDDDDEFVF